MNRQEFIKTMNDLNKQWHDKKFYLNTKITEYDDKSGNIVVSYNPYWTKGGWCKNTVICESHAYNPNDWLNIYTTLYEQTCKFLEEFGSTNSSIWKEIEKHEFTNKLISKLDMSKDKLKVSLMEGRIVFLYTIEEEHNMICADCGSPATMLIYELDQRTWFYCGTCRPG